MGSARPVNEDRAQARRGALSSCTRASHHGSWSLSAGMSHASDSKMINPSAELVAASSSSLVATPFIIACTPSAGPSGKCDGAAQSLSTPSQAIAVLLVSGAAAPELMESMRAWARF